MARGKGPLHRDSERRYWKTTYIVGLVKPATLPDRESQFPVRRIFDFLLTVAGGLDNETGRMKGRDFSPPLLINFWSILF
jgi:hypothetical protein